VGMLPSNSKPASIKYRCHGSRGCVCWLGLRGERVVCWMLGQTSPSTHIPPP
jgi:hypothetical protein